MGNIRISVPRAGTRFLLLMAALFAMVAMAATAVTISADYDTTIIAAGQRNTVLAQMVEEHARRAFDISKASLDDIADLVMADGTPRVTRGTAARMRWWLDDIPQISAFWVFDATGKVLFTTEAVDVSARNVADREYFQAHARGDAFHISRMMRGRFGGHWFFAMSKRLTDKEGRFRGVLAASTDMDNFTAVYARLDLAPTDNVAIFKPDGAIVARRLVNFKADGDVGPHLGNHPLITQLIPNAPSGTFEATSTIDGVRRLLAYRKVDGWPLYVSAACDVERAIAPFRDRAARTIAYSLGVLVALGFVTWWGYGRISAEEEAQARNGVLLNEVHHRVKNNLAIIQSLLLLEANRAPPEARNGYEKSISRVEAMGLVHNMLYASQDFAGVDAAQYITRLCEALQASAPDGIIIVSDIAPLTLPLDTAMPVALVVNEVVLNALRHAFTSGRTGTVTVRLTAGHGSATLTIRDDGAGMPAGTGPAKGSGLGLMLVRQLARQLGGTAAIESRDGTVFTLNFPIAEGSASI